MRELELSHNETTWMSLMIWFGIKNKNVTWMQCHINTVYFQLIPFRLFTLCELFVRKNAVYTVQAVQQSLFAFIVLRFGEGQTSETTVFVVFVHITVYQRQIGNARSGRRVFECWKTFRSLYRNSESWKHAKTNNVKYSCAQHNCQKMMLFFLLLATAPRYAGSEISVECWIQLRIMMTGKIIKSLSSWR